VSKRGRHGPSLGWRTGRFSDLFLAHSSASVVLDRTPSPFQNFPAGRADQSVRSLYAETLKHTTILFTHQGNSFHPASLSRCSSVGNSNINISGDSSMSCAFPSQSIFLIRDTLHAANGLPPCAPNLAVLRTLGLMFRTRVAIAQRLSISPLSKGVSA